MSAQQLESFLAQLYVDETARHRFLANPRVEAINAGLSEQDCAGVEQIDRVGLEFAADSFAKKRAGQKTRKVPSRLSWWFKNFGGGDGTRGDRTVWPNPKVNPTQELRAPAGRGGWRR